MLRLVFSIFVCCLFVRGIAQASQILTNPGFEIGSTAPWTSDMRFSLGVDWAMTSANCQDGNFCATEDGNVGLKQTFSPVAVSAITGISFWASHPNGTAPALSADFFYADGQDEQFIVNTTGTGWTYFDVFANLRTTGALDGFEIFGNTSGVTVADEFTITTTPEPATVCLLSAALLLLRVNRKRLTSSVC